MAWESKEWESKRNILKMWDENLMVKRVAWLGMRKITYQVTCCLHFWIWEIGFTSLTLSSWHVGNWGNICNVLKIL